MDLSIWTKRIFDINSKIEWPCPHCSGRKLILKKDNLMSEETAESMKYRQENDDWDIEWVNLVFCGKLICENCNETVFFTGKGSPEGGGVFDESTGDFEYQYENRFTPTFFEPCIKVFDIPSKCPDQLKKEIESSFKLFWCDLPSCANKIRIALEVLMDEFKVKKFERTGRRKVIPLHQRIENFKNNEVKDTLLAIKWIGNIGSHYDSIETVDILDAYRLLEFALNKIFNDETKEIEKIAKEINKRKGTRKK